MEAAMQAPLTEHARIRMQQRGIPPAALEVLLDYGREAHDHQRGCLVVLFNKRCRRILAEQLGRQGIRRAPLERLCRRRSGRCSGHGGASAAEVRARLTGELAHFMSRPSWTMRR
jgi:hypothetical protein